LPDAEALDFAGPPLTISEVSSVTQLSRKEIGLLIDHGDLPKVIISKSSGQRMLGRIGVAMVHFLSESGPSLSRAARQDVVLHLSAFANGETDQLQYQMGAICIDLRACINTAAQSLERLSNAKALVVEDPDVRGGLPVLAGTRIGPYEAAGLGEDEEAVLEGFPSLTPELIAVAKIYAQAYPRKRPQKTTSRARKAPHATVVKKIKLPRG
jgi:uncharacterized protein (DUF433 family)